MPFEGALHVNTYGYTRGIWLLWYLEVADIAKLASMEQEIHALVKVRSSNISWIIFAIYASPKIVECSCLWNNLSIVAKLHRLPWVMLGDFNEVLSSNEKFRGNLVCIRQVLRFKECLDDCGMMDLGFCGPRYTWSNLRDISDLILERLDC